MAIYIQETSRSFPNVDSGGEYKQEWQRPSSSNYESHAHHSGMVLDIVLHLMMTDQVHQYLVMIGYIILEIMMNNVLVMTVQH